MPNLVARTPKNAQIDHLYRTQPSTTCLAPNWAGLRAYRHLSFCPRFLPLPRVLDDTGPRRRPTAPLLLPLCLPPLMLYHLLWVRAYKVDHYLLYYLLRLQSQIRTLTVRRSVLRRAVKNYTPLRKRTKPLFLYIPLIIKRRIKRRKIPRLLKLLLLLL